MKKSKMIGFIAAVLFVSSAMNASADLDTVLALSPITATLNAFMESELGAQVQNALKYVQMVENAIATVQNTYNMVQNAIRMEQRMIENLKSVANVKDLDSFMDWTNRQIALERMADMAFNNISVKIGGSRVSLANIQELPELAKKDIDSVINMSDKDKEKIWIKAGISPANYAYIKTWDERLKTAFTKAVGMVDAYKEKDNTTNDRLADIFAKYMTPDEEMNTNAVIKDTNVILAAMTDTMQDVRNEINQVNQTLLEQEQRKKRVAEPLLSGKNNEGWGKPVVDARFEDFD